MSRFAPPSAEELAARGLDPDGNPLKTTKVRARNSDGTLKADDPNTPENEAWEEVPVKKRGRLRKKGKLCLVMYRQSVSQEQAHSQLALLAYGRYMFYQDRVHLD